MTRKRNTAPADMAQLVEHILGKDEVTSSNLVISSKHSCESKGAFLFSDERI